MSVLQSRRATLRTLALSAVTMAPHRTRAQVAVDSARILVGFPAGGTADIVARRLADRLRDTYARTTIVDNRAGAGGRVAIELMKTVPPDGATLLMTPGSMLYVYPHIYSKLAYNPFEDLTPVSVVCSTVFGFAVGPAVPESVKTLRDFLGWARANPDKANYGTPAAGSTPHFIAALVAQSANVDLRHAPYRGSQPAILDMLGSQLTAVSAPLGEFLPHVKGGQVRVLASSGPARSKYFPSVPTLLELGFKDLEVVEPYAVFLPARAGADTVRRAVTAVRAAVAMPEFVEGIAQMGLDAVSGTPEELTGVLRQQLERWGPLVKAVGFKADS